MVVGLMVSLESVWEAHCALYLLHAELGATPPGCLHSELVMRYRGGTLLTSPCSGKSIKAPFRFSRSGGSVVSALVATLRERESPDFRIRFTSTVNIAR